MTRMIRVLAKASNTVAVSPSLARTIATAGVASARSAAADHPGAGALVADRWTLLRQPSAPSAGGSRGATASNGVGVVPFRAMPGKDGLVLEHHGGLGGRSRRTASEAPGGLVQAAVVNGVPFRGKAGVLGEPLGALVTRPVHVKPKVTPFTAFAGYRTKVTSAVAGVKDAAKAKTKTKKNPVERLVWDTLDRAALARERLARLLLGPRTSPERIAVDAALKWVHRICFGDGSVIPRPLPSSDPSIIKKTNQFVEELRAAGAIDADGRLNQAQALGVVVSKITELLDKQNAFMILYHRLAGLKELLFHALFALSQMMLFNPSKVLEFVEAITGHKTWESLFVKVQEQLEVSASDWVQEHVAALDQMRDNMFMYNFLLLDDHFA